MIFTLMESLRNLIRRILSEEGNYTLPSKDITFEDILEARKIGGKTLNEASLGRVYQHFLKSDKNSFAILTSWRFGEEETLNEKNFAQLKSELRKEGLGFFRLDGHWQECKRRNVPYEKCPPEELVDAYEPSLFVPNIDFSLFQTLLAKYNQNAGVYSGPQTGGKVQVVSNVGTVINIGNFSPDKIAQNYSTLKHGKHATRNFVFEYATQSWSESLLETALAKQEKNQK